jgi:hypothetical protein
MVVVSDMMWWILRVFEMGYGVVYLGSLKSQASWRDRVADYPEIANEGKSDFAHLV